ncbi:MAG: glycosyltransferase [Holophagales bacterium]|nr:glycosyltransferase [Holophagales bacterium]
MRQRLRQADIFLHLAVSEGFCNAVLEAQASGVPVVASDAGGLPENVANGETGILVPAREPGAAADALARLARDPDLRRRMGEAGCRRARQHFHLETQLTAFEDLYHRVLRAPGRGVP